MGADIDPPVYFGGTMFNGKRVSIVIAAAGSGKRMRTGDKNKVYIELQGKTILERVFDVFESNEKVDRIIVAVKMDELEFCRKEVLPKEKHDKLMDVIPGGSERCHSVYNALERLDEEDIVLIHDGARPFVDNEIIDKCIEAVYEHGSCAAGVPVKDTIKIVKDGLAVNTPDRRELFAMHTPQGFFAGDIKKYIKCGIDEGYFGTDEASFAEKQGKKVFIVESKYDNIKVTTSEDLIIAEAILMKRRNKE